MDISQLSHDLTPTTVRPVTPGRTLLVDGDFVAYFVSTGDEETLEDMQENARTCLDNLREAAGAEFISVHMTARGSTKGGRYNIARQLKYQDNRAGKDKPEYLESIRNYMLQLCSERPGDSATLWTDLEADDGISIEAHQKPYGSVVIISRDKDLGIIPGLHMDWGTSRIYSVDFAGNLSYIKTESKGKLLGTGFKFFCAQMLMGDKADNIRGLPRVITPNGPRLCGPKTAYELLNGLDVPSLCIKRVLLEYRKYGEAVGFVDYNGNPMTAEEAFESEARLLWLRRTFDPDDVLTVFKEVNNGEALY